MMGGPNRDLRRRIEPIVLLTKVCCLRRRLQCPAVPPLRQLDDDTVAGDLVHDHRAALLKHLAASHDIDSRMLSMRA